jgi:hypothetical protein
VLGGFDLFQKIVEVGSYKTLEELVQVFEKEKKYALHDYK